MTVNTLGSSPSRGRGRPTVLDRDAIAEAALFLWSKNGYAQTGWREIAEATGVSERTLTRHFSSKAAVAWSGVESATLRLSASLASSKGLPSQQAIRTAVVDSIAHQALIDRVGPLWVRLVTEEPELRAAAPLAFRPWIAVLAEHINLKIPGSPPAIGEALALAYQSAAMAALAHWEQQGAVGDAAHTVDELLQWLDVHVPYPSQPSLNC